MFKMSNDTYDILKYIAQIVLPACGTLYSAVSGIWGLPYGEQIVATIMAVDLFMGAVLKISTDNYNKAG
jgi:hypothetical protein